MLRLGKRQRDMWIDTLSQTANLALAGMLFGQFVSERPFSTRVALGGVCAWGALLLWSTLLARDKK